MLYFVLPNFFESFSLNNYFAMLTMAEPSVFKEEIKFTAMSGNFPYNYWDGSNCNMIGTGVFSQEIIDFNKQNQIPLRFSCNNLFLQEQDFEDSLNSIILDNGQKRNNEIEIANFKLLDYLNEHYYNFKYILSYYATYMTEFTPDLLNNILEFNKFALIQIPPQFSTDKEFLSKINDKTKLEIVAGTVCSPHCRNFDNCIIQQHQNQYNFSRSSIFGNCPLTRNKIYIKDITALKEFYLPLGISHFTLPPLRNSFSYLEVVNFYIQYFIKEEYQFRIFADIEHIFGKEIANDPFYYPGAI